METTLYIKNMVCPRCIMVVRDEILKLGFELNNIQLGIAELKNTLTDSEYESVRAILEKNGFELLDDKKSRLIEKVKLLIIEAVQKNIFSDSKINLSEYLSENMHMEYTHLSSVFSSAEGRTIEKFLILQKVERIKELMSYDELSIKEIADQMGYSSLQALSTQFKKETGITPTNFKKVMDAAKRKPISDV